MVVRSCIRRSFLPPLATAALVCGCARAPEDPLELAARRITPDAIDRHGKRLAADELHGRYYASPGADSAAAIILGQLARIGVAPVAEADALLDGRAASFRHHFAVTLVRVGAATQLVVRRARAERGAQLGYDFLPLVFAADGSVTGSLTWIHRAVDVDGDVRGRIAAVTEGALETDLPVETALYRMAVRLEERGARAVLFAGDTDILYNAATSYPSFLPPALRSASASELGRRRNLHADRLALAAQAQAQAAAPRRTLPAFVVRSAWIGRLHTGDEVRLSLRLEPEVSLGLNVLVGFRGSLRPDEIVLLAAHYDHGGVTAAGDVLNGANDNATGVAALLEIGAALRSVEPELRRSVVLAFLAGETPGLHGSATLLHDLPQLLGPEARIVAALGLRALGGNGPRPVLLVGATQHTDLAAVVERCNRREVLLGPALALQRFTDTSGAIGQLDLAPVRTGSYRTFARAGIPALGFNDGADLASYGLPEDDWKQVDTHKVARVARLAFRAAYELAREARAEVVPASAVRP